MEQADQILFLNFSRWNCLFRAWKRYCRYKGRVRESMAAGCPERFDWEFIRWILWDGRTKSARERYQSIHSTYPEKFLSQESKRARCVSKKHTIKRLGYHSQPFLFINVIATGEAIVFF